MAADDAAILDAWMAGSRRRAAQKRACRGRAFSTEGGRKKIPSNWSSGRSHNPIDKPSWRLFGAQITTGPRHAQRLLTLVVYLPTLLLAEQRMFSQSDRMLAASNITLASIEMSYIMGHLSKRRFDKVRVLRKARRRSPSTRCSITCRAWLRRTRQKEFAYLEKVYAKDQRHFDVLTRLAKHYDDKGDSKATGAAAGCCQRQPPKHRHARGARRTLPKRRKGRPSAEQYLKLIEAVPFHEEALTFLADDAQKKGDKATELKYIQAMIKEPQRPERRTREAKLLAETNQVDAAEKAYKRLLEGGPQNGRREPLRRRNGCR